MEMGWFLADAAYGNESAFRGGKRRVRGWLSPAFFAVPDPERQKRVQTASDLAVLDPSSATALVSW